VQSVSNAFHEGRSSASAGRITEGTLLRFLLREGRTAPEAIALLESIRERPWHTFWRDALPVERAHLGGVIGHRQVTDAYLVALAAHHGSMVVSFDRGLAALHPNHVLLLT
jgi:uncharacterized protein